MCSKIVFGIYIILLTYFLFFAESTGRMDADRSYHYNLIPLKEIKRFLNYYQTLGFQAVLLNLLGNIVAFIPFGMILPVLHQRFRAFGFMMLLTLEFSLGVEVIQLAFKVGSFDVDDLLLNTIGGVLGYIIFMLMDRIRRQDEKKKTKRI
jgi:glycopeptide antibiotics resistance protein